MLIKLSKNTMQLDFGSALYCGLRIYIFFIDKKINVQAMF